MSEAVRLPAVAGLFHEGDARALRAEVEESLPATRARPVARGDSENAFGDTSQVVGWAAVLWKSREAAGEMES